MREREKQEKVRATEGDTIKPKKEERITYDTLLEHILIFLLLPFYRLPSLTTSVFEEIFCFDWYMRKRADLRPPPYLPSAMKWSGE